MLLIWLIIGCADVEDVTVDTGKASDCNDLTYANVGQPYMLTYCTSCHSSMVAGDDRRGAPDGTDFETLDGIDAHQDRILDRIQQRTMPPGGGAVEEETERVLQWLECGLVGTENALPSASESLDGVASEMSLSAEEVGGEYELSRTAELGTWTELSATWSTERYQLSGESAWWMGYTLYNSSGEVFRDVSFDEGVRLTEEGDWEIMVTIEEEGLSFEEVWDVSVQIMDSADPVDGRESSWQVEEVLVFAGEEEHGWHLSADRGIVAQWMVLDADRSWISIQSSDVMYSGTGFPINSDFRWIERLLASSGWPR